MTDLLHRPGFLGTNANFAADMTLLLSLAVAILFSIGFYLARKGKYDTHKWVQTAGAVTNIILVLWLMVLPYRDFIVNDQGGPREGVFYAVTILHAVIGFFAFVLGNFVVLRGHNLVPSKLRFQNYVPFMRTAYGLYITTTLLGVWVYMTWFITTAKPPTF
jgi:uncharacterized membrane protein YozB (DUF420 family)